MKYDGYYRTIMRRLGKALGSFLDKTDLAVRGLPAEFPERKRRTIFITVL